MNLNFCIKFLLVIFVGSITVLPSCKKPNIDKEDPILIELNGEYLLESQLQELSPSLVLTHSEKSNLINDWIKETLIAQAGEKELYQIKEIDKLVKAYRSSLIKKEYEENYLMTNLNDSVRPEEVKNYYAAHESEFVNGQNYIKALLAKVPIKLDVSEKFEDLWENDDIASMKALCQENNLLCLLKADTLYSINHLKVLLPSSLHSALGKNKNVQQKKGDYEYFVKTLELYDNKSDNAFEIHHEKIIQSILFARKKQLLIHLRDSLYNDAIEKNRIKIFENE